MRVEAERSVRPELPPQRDGVHGPAASLAAPDERRFPEAGQRSFADVNRLREAAEQLNRAAAIFNRRISFEVHEGTGRLQVRVIDQRKGEVVAEFPPEKLLDVLAAIQEQIGLILDKVI